MSCFFSDIVIDHFREPKNVGKMEDADAQGTCGEPGCGDSLTIYIKVNEDVITHISYLVYGCVAAIATSSMTSVMAKGKTLEQAYKITDEDIIMELGGLPDYKLHCSVLGASALQKAIDNYRSKQDHIRAAQ